MNANAEECVGYIQLVFLDDINRLRDVLANTP